MNQDVTTSAQHLDSNIVPLHEAIENAQRWREFCKATKDLFHDQNYLVKGFYISMTDLQALVENYKHHNPTGARAYIGLRPPARPGETQNRMQLLLVPATETMDFYNCGVSPLIGLDGSSIYDFTMPCPNSCADDNPMNTDNFHVD